MWQENNFNIKTYDDFLSMEDWEYVVKKTICGNEWSFRGGNPNYKLWTMGLENDDFFSEHMFSLIKKINPNFRLRMVYANGQTHGICGDLHRDVDGPKALTANRYYTFIYYANFDWLPQFGGSTIFSSDDSGTEVYTHYPKPNSAVLFDSTILHAGLQPTSFFNGLRVTIAFKLKLI